MDWKAMNLVGRSYLDLQQTRIACDGRLRKLAEEGKASAESEIAKMLKKHRAVLHAEEKTLLKSSVDFVKGSALWDWCERVRGLGPVAGMTFLAHINPEICTSAGKFWAYIGLIPGAKMKSGEKGKYNPELKGRFWVIGRNVIMARDSYYPAFYRIEKEYLMNRPDLQEKKGEGMKGWKGWMDAMAKRWMLKLITSHALEIIRRSNGMDFNPHHNYIPPKPETVFECNSIVGDFRREKLTSVRLVPEHECIGACTMEVKKAPEKRGRA